MPIFAPTITADMAKLVDVPDLGSGAARRVGSSPIIRTFKKLLNRFSEAFLFLLISSLLFIHFFFFTDKRVFRLFYFLKEFYPKFDLATHLNTISLDS